MIRYVLQAGAVVLGQAWRIQRQAGSRFMKRTVWLSSSDLWGTCMDFKYEWVCIEDISYLVIIENNRLHKYKPLYIKNAFRLLPVQEVERRHAHWMSCEYMYVCHCSLTAEKLCKCLVFSKCLRWCCPLCYILCVRFLLFYFIILLSQLKPG